MTEPAEPQPDPAPQSTEEADKPDGSRHGNHGLAIAIVVLLVLLVLLMIGASKCSGPKHDDSNDLTLGDAGVLAKDACRSAVKGGLKAPSTAQFSDEVTKVTSQDGLDFVFNVTGIVEAQNSFGGTVGNDFECAATVLKSTGDASGVLLQMTER